MDIYFFNKFFTLVDILSSEFYPQALFVYNFRRNSLNEDLRHLWESFLSDLKKTEISTLSYDAFFKKLAPVKLTEDTLYISSPNFFIGNHVKTNESYYKYMVDIFEKLLGRKLNFEFVQTGEVVEDFGPTSQDQLLERSRLNPKYTFDTFVVGKSNEFAHAASVSVADSLEKANANPLFIYGGVGLGKTHLMHAIGHVVLERDPNKKVLYVSSEQFTNEFINSIRTNKNEEFRHKYRSMDLLLIDDIQFIADKETTMEEFFHTFNELYNANKQIVLTSDKPPNTIPRLESRLISRFAGGLVVDIAPPDLETRIAILRKKSDAEGFQVPDEVINYVAKQVQSNIRELEGALSRVTAYSKLTTGHLDIETASLALNDLYKNQKVQPITPDSIKKVICKNYNLSLEDLDSKNRSRAISYPRQIAMYMCRKYTDLSLLKIGESFGGRDHSTVIHAYEKISEDLEKNPSLQGRVHQMLREVKGEL